MKFFKCMLLIGLLVYLLHITVGMALVVDHFKGDYKSRDAVFEPKRLANDRLYCIDNGRECHYLFAKNIYKPMYYTNLLLFLYTAPKSTTLYLHLAGNGGRSMSSILITNAIQYSKVGVITIAEAGVYSAHAMIALAGKSIIIKQGALFVFHIPAYGKSVESICAGEKGKLDRGQDKYVKCLQFLEISLDVSTKFTLSKLKVILTNDEYKDLLAGHDIYVTGDDMRKRLAEKNVHKVD